MVCKFAFFFLTCYSPLKVLGIWPCQDAVREPPALFSLRPLSLLWTRLPPYRGASQRSASKSQEVLRKAPKAKSMDPSLLLPSHTSKTSAQNASVLFSNWGGLKTSNDGKNEISCEMKRPVLITWSEIVFMSRAPCASSIFVLTLIVTLFVYCVLWKLVIGWESLWASILIN